MLALHDASVRLQRRKAHDATEGRARHEHLAVGHVEGRRLRLPGEESMSDLPQVKLKKEVPCIVPVAGRIAYVDAKGHAYWLRVGARCRDEGALQELRRTQDRLSAERSGLLLPDDSGKLVKAP